MTTGTGAGTGAEIVIVIVIGITANVETTETEGTATVTIDEMTVIATTAETIAKNRRLTMPCSRCSQTPVAVHDAMTKTDVTATMIATTIVEGTEKSVDLDSPNGRNRL